MPLHNAQKNQIYRGYGAPFYLSARKSDELHNQWQAVRIVKVIIKRYPEQVGLPFYLWIHQAVVMLIEKRYGIHLSLWTIGQYRPRTRDGMINNVRRHLYVRQRNPKLVKKYYQEKHVKYAAI